MKFPFLRTPVAINAIAILNTKIIAGSSAATFYMSGVYNIISIVTTNIKLFILLYLSFVFIKALYLNLNTKHNSENSNLKLLYKLKYIIINVKNIVLNVKNLNKTNVYLIVKIFILLVFLRLILRSFIYLLLNNENNTLNNIISVLLSLTFILYFSNLIIKYFKKDRYTYNDFYLYNNYVIENVNIYNIFYIVGANYVIMNYNKLLITIIVIIFFTIPVIYIFNYISRYDPKFNDTNLKAALPDISVFLYIGFLLKEATEKAYGNFVPGSITHLDKIIGIPHEENGIIKCYKASLSDKNNIHRSTMDDGQDIQLRKIEQTPIIKIAYEQINVINKLAHYLYSTLNITGLFVKDNLNVSIIRSSKDHLLVTLFFKDKGMYMPNFYYGFNVRKSLEILGENLNVNLNRIYGNIEGMIIMTPAEITGLNTLRIFRPDIYYSDLNMVQSNIWEHMNIYKQDNFYFSELLNIELSEILNQKNFKHFEQRLADLGNKIHDKHQERVKWDNSLILSNVETIPCVDNNREEGQMFYLKRVDDHTLLDHGILFFSGKKLALNGLSANDLKKDGYSLFHQPFNVFKSWSEFLHVSRKELVIKVQDKITYGSPSFLSWQTLGILIEGSSHEYFYFDGISKEFNYWANYGDNNHVKCNIFSLIDLDAGKKESIAKWTSKKINHEVPFSYYDTASYQYGEKSVERMREKYCKFINDK